MRVEILPPAQQPDPERAARFRALGEFGTILALLTMLAAFGVGFLALFGTTLAAAAIVTLAWSALFSPEFTAWVFGSEKVNFWKIFLLLFAAGMASKIFRGNLLWQRK